MNLRPSSVRSRVRRNTGISLIECLVYIALLVVVMGAGFMALYHATVNHRNLRRNADDIAAAVNVGELWRKDIRAATGRITAETGVEGQLVRIPQVRGEVTYQFAAGQLRRQQQAGSAWTVLLPRVQTSSMTADRREHVTEWRWELTLRTTSRQVRIKPTFSFNAVPRVETP